MGISWYTILFCLFFFAAFRILSLSLTSTVLIVICLGVGLLGFILFGTLHASCTWISVSFKFWKFLATVSSYTFSILFSLFSFWNPYNANVGMFDVISEISYIALFFFLVCLSDCCNDWVISIILPSRSLMHSSVSFNLLFFTSKVLFVSNICSFIFSSSFYK